MRLDHFWTIRYISQGKVVWEGKNLENQIANQGIASILEYFYRGNANYKPAQFFVRLCNYVPQVTDTLSSVSTYEPNITSGSIPLNGYAPQLVTDFPTSTQDANGSTLTITSAQVVFTADGGNIGPVTTAFVATSNGPSGTSPDSGGKLISYLPLAITRTILNGDSMTYFWTTQES
jgi:hypothetical protein